MSENKHTIQDELKDARELQRLSIPAKRLKEKLSPIPSKVEFLQKRWFWELLQNASDYNDTVDVRLELYDDRVVFKHNGLPFRAIDTENLISPDSGKDDEEMEEVDTIGEFGTGFISTHVLSAKITVSGVIKSKNQEGKFFQFKFLLDRTEYDSKEFLKRSIKKAEDQLDSEVEPIEHTPGAFYSSFSYDLTAPFSGSDPISVVGSGLENINEVLPFTMAFLPKVRQVTIVNRSEKFGQKGKRFFSRSGLDNGNVSIHRKAFDENEQLVENVSFNLRQFSSGNVTTIVRVEGNSVVPYPPSISKLFKALPMIGTEDYALPMVLNSLEFKPTTERDGIELSSNDELNRSLLANGVSAFKQMLETLASEGVSDLYHLASWPQFSNSSNKITSWYKSNISIPIADVLRETPVVEGLTARVMLGKAYVPYEPREEMDKERMSELYDIFSPGLQNKLPKKEHHFHWYHTLDFKRFTKVKVTLEVLIKFVAGKEDLNALVGIADDHKKWLLNIHTFLLKHQPNLFDQYKLIPNTHGKFFLRTGEIYWDDGVPPELIRILQKLSGEDFYNKLLHPEFEENTDLLPPEKKKGLKDIADEIDNCFKEFNADGIGGKPLEALRETFKWFVDSGLEESKLKILFPWFSSKRPQLFLETFDDVKRDQAFVIVQSGKLKSLSKLAETDLTEEEIEKITENPTKLRQFLAFREQVVDDITFADEETGNIGEGIVFSILKERFQEPEYSVSDVSKSIAEYDFVVHKGDEEIFFVDAKTTKGGVANTGSIPFFVRKSQWDFLGNERAKGKYLIARVFVEGEKLLAVKWIKIEKEESIFN